MTQHESVLPTGRMGEFLSHVGIKMVNCLQAPDRAGKVVDVPTSAVMKKSKNWLEANQIEFVECLVPDFNGLAKGKTVPAKELVSGVIRLPEAIFGQDITGEWCHEFDLLDVADVDMVLLPDASTLVSQPWSNTNTAQCICDCQSKDGSVLDIAPRSILRKVISLFADLGMQRI